MRAVLSRRAHKRGFTFIEVMIAVVLLVMGFLGVYASLHACALLREAANETNVAMFKLQTTMEYLFSVPFDDITTTLPEGTALDIVALMDSDTDNDYTLCNEVVTISYEDPAADLLKFTITINWTARRGTGRYESISSGRGR